VCARVAKNTPIHCDSSKNEIKKIVKKKQVTSVKKTAFFKQNLKGLKLQKQKCRPAIVPLLTYRVELQKQKWPAIVPFQKSNKKILSKKLQVPKFEGIKITKAKMASNCPFPL
jgi:hypothetical protein